MKNLFKSCNIPFIAVGLLALVLGCVTFWTGDGVDYQYIYQPDGSDPSPADHIGSIRDVFVSQVNHYFVHNGRTFIHFWVQVFCGLFGRYVFAICNAVVWAFLPSALLKVGGVNITLRSAVVASALTLFLFFYLFPDPPYQISYVWVALATCGFLSFYFKSDYLSKHASGSRAKAPVFFLLALASLCYGNCLEAYSFMAGMMILAYAVRRRFRLSPLQWTCGLLLAAGAVLILLSPAAWERFNSTSSAGATEIINRLEDSWQALIIPLIYVGVCIFTRRKEPKADLTIGNYLLWTGFAASVLLWMILKFISGARTLIPANLMLAILLLRRMEGLRLNVAGLALWALTGLAVMGAAIGINARESVEMSRLVDAYRNSSDGTVYVPDEVYIRRQYRFTDRRESFERDFAYRVPGQQQLKLRPSALQGVRLPAKGDSTVQFAPNAWLLFKDTRDEGRIIVEKTFLPGLLNKRMADRELDFYAPREVVIDSAGFYRIGVYINSRPYVESDIKIKH